VQELAELLPRHPKLWEKLLGGVTRDLLDRMALRWNLSASAFLEMVAAHQGVWDQGGVK
jgi:hypothetical protein